jgi:hypothetical protein
LDQRDTSNDLNGHSEFLNTAKISKPETDDSLSAGELRPSFPPTDPEQASKALAEAIENDGNHMSRRFDQKRPDRRLEDDLGWNHTSKAGVDEGRLEKAKKLIIELTEGSAFSEAEIRKLHDV